MHKAWTQRHKILVHPARRFVEHREVSGACCQPQLECLIASYDCPRLNNSIKQVVDIVSGWQLFQSRSWAQHPKQCAFFPLPRWFKGLPWYDWQDLGLRGIACSDLFKLKD